MNILIIGSGGREHAIASSYSKSSRIRKVFVAPGNDFMEESSGKIETVPHLTFLDRSDLLEFARQEKIDLVDVAGDEPLAEGLVDVFSEYGIPTFGPTKKSSEIEWNKSWARDFMKKYNLPIPKYQKFTSEKEALKYINKKRNGVMFVKASGLAGGKGAIKAESKEEAIKAINSMKDFGKSGAEFLIEDGMTGEEFSLFAICDGKRYLILGNAQDHKTVFENGRGPNTGGMGCVSPISSLNQKLITLIKKSILSPVIHGMSLEGRPFTGILYLGGMLTQKGVRIIEFNARWGDPEAEVILPGIKTDYLKIVESVLMQELMTMKINFDKKIRVSIAACASGYPDDYKNVVNKKISGIKKASEVSGITIFGAGLKRKNKNYFVNGGRILHIVAEGENVEKARAKAYEAMSYLYIEDNNLHFRTDIGFRELEKNL